MSALNQTPAATDAAAPVIAGENDDLTTEQPAAANADDFATTKLAPPAGDVVPPWPDRPQIRIADGELPEILDASERVIAQHFYSRGTSLVRITAARELPAELKHPTNANDTTSRRDRPDDQRVILDCAPSYLATEITRCADVTKHDARSKGSRKTDFPEKYARAMLERKRWPNVRPLDAIVRAPFVREDGSICDQPGYDPKSRCFADFDPYEFYELQDSISEEAAAAALDKLLAPFDQFPYETPAARSAFAAHILTEAARIATPCAPAFWYTAPDPSTGKTSLSKMAATIVHGAEPAIRTWPNTAEELRKTIFASLLVGDRSIMFDNVGGGAKVRSPELCAFITAPVYGDRKLGVSENLTLPNKAVVCGTGNNLNPVADLARRSLVVRLNGNMPGSALRQRVFRIPDLAGYVRSHRVELLMAALTVIKAHQQSGHVGPTTLPTFERWSQLVRDALIWLGLPDPCETQVETDDGSDTLADAFTSLAPKLEGQQFTPGDVAALTMFDKQLAAALHDGGCSDPNSAQKVGYWLRENRDRYGGAFRLQLAASYANSNHSKRYQFVRVRTSADANADLIGEAVGSAR